jgi:regulator of protease activity HflC (stomatin/prohibitin superfamily)
MARQQSNPFEPEGYDYDSPQFVIRVILLIILAIIVVIFLFGSWYMVGAGERVIVLTFRNPSDHIQGPGFHFKIPIVQSIVRMNVRTQTVSFDNKAGTGDNSEYSSLFAASKDLQDVQIATVVNFYIEEKDVLQIYNQYGDMHSYQVNVLEPLIRDTVKTVSATYTAEDLVTKRTSFNIDVAAVLQKRFAEKSANFERVNIVNFQFSPEYTKAIESKVVQEQLKQKATIELETIKIQAEQRISSSKGEAEAIRIQMESLRQNGGAEYIKLKALENQAKAIEKWQGTTPSVLVNGGDSSGMVFPLIVNPSAMNSTA